MKKKQRNFFREQAAFIAMLGVLFLSAAPAAAESSHRGVNMTVDSSDIGPVDVNKKTDPDQKPPQWGDDSLSMGFNENSEPNVGMRF